MKQKRGWLGPAKRYSEAFQREVIGELESGGLSCSELHRKYGLCHGTVRYWLRKHGNGSRKVIRVETPEEIDQLKRLKQRVRQLESALADSNIELALERAYVAMACERAGIKDLAAFKKKAGGKRRSGR